jgi:hypothetical protein
LVKQSRTQHSERGQGIYPLLFYVYDYSNVNSLPDMGLTKLGLELAEYISKGKI